MADATIQVNPNNFVRHYCKMVGLSFPTIVTLCGSSRFKEAFERAAKIEELAGRLVFTIGFFGHHEPGFDMDETKAGSPKAKVDELHLRKIDLSDEILVINPLCHLCNRCGKPCEVNTKLGCSSCCSAPFGTGRYIGASTIREIEYAKRCGKVVRFFEGLQLGEIPATRPNT